MKLVTFVLKSEDTGSGQQARPGAIIKTSAEPRVLDLSGLGYSSMLQFIEAGAAAQSSAEKLVSSGPTHALAEVRLLAPLPKPPRIFAVGLNYQSHAAESKMAVQKVPTVFMKLSSSVTGPDTDIVLPALSSQPDYEAELAVVIGRPGYQIKADDWREHVFGYTICNDVSARDIQLSTSQWTLGKSFPTFAPLGPAITTADELTDPHALDVSLTIDGEVLQKANTRDLIFKVPELIRFISSTTPLEAGDIISTGTPEGVGLGRSPQRWLRPGEEIVITIEGIGTLRNRTVAE